MKREQSPDREGGGGGGVHVGGEGAVALLGNNGRSASASSECSMEESGKLT